MATVFKRFAVVTFMTSIFVGCQSFDTARIKNVKETEQTKQNALIHCAGTSECEFERFNQIPVVDAKSHRVTRKALKQGIVRLEPASAEQINPMYLSVPAGQHEVVIRFYPISKDKAETLHIIHKFNAKHRYTLKMFRERSKNRGNLLNVSAPDPLCVDLKQDRKTIRRFCKPYNVLNGLGEFVEKKNFKSR